MCGLVPCLPLRAALILPDYLPPTQHHSLPIKEQSCPASPPEPRLGLHAFPLRPCDRCTSGEGVMPYLANALKKNKCPLTGDTTGTPPKLDLGSPDSPYAAFYEFNAASTRPPISLACLGTAATTIFEAEVRASHTQPHISKEPTSSKATSKEASTLTLGPCRTAGDRAHRPVRRNDSEDGRSPCCGL